MENKEEKTKKEISAKTTSLVGQIFAAIWIAGWNAFQFIKDIVGGTHVEVTDIIYSGIAVAACFSPVYVSIVMDKIKDIRFGNGNDGQR